MSITNTTRTLLAKGRSSSWRALAGGELVIAVMWVVGFLMPWYTDLYYVRLGTLAAIGAMLALSLNLMYGFAGQISFGHGGFYAIGAYGAAIAAERAGLGFPSALLLGTVLSGVLATVIGYPILRLRGHFLGLATLAFGLLVWTILRQWLDVTGGPSGISLPAPAVFGMDIQPSYFHMVVLILLLLVYLFVRGLVNSKVGWAMRALRADERGAAAVGVPVIKYKVMAFALAGLLAGLAGALYAFLDQYLTPETFSINASILILTMVVVGGLGSNVGAVIGGVVLSVIPQVLLSIQEYQQLLYGAILLSFLLFLPRGIVGLRIPGVVRKP